MSRIATAAVFLSVLALCVLGQLWMLQHGNGVVAEVPERVLVTELPPPGTPWWFCPGPLDDGRPKPKQIFWQRERQIRWPAAFRRAQQE